MKKKYKVSIGLMEFIFNNCDDAVAFAGTALRHFEKKGDKEITVTIYCKEDEENED